MVPKKSISKQGGKQSIYSNDNGGTDHLNGLRVKLTVTINALGLMAAPFISVTRISREKLPLDVRPSGVYIIRIPGLCSGLSVDPRHDASGYITFVRCEKNVKTQISAEQRSFEWYRTNVLFPFIELSRVKYYGWVTGTYIPNDLTTCYWCDGANVQFNTIKSKRLKDVDKTKKVVTCKHSRSRTAVEQACDTSPIFRSIKVISQNITTESAPYM